MWLTAAEPFFVRKRGKQQLPMKCWQTKNGAFIFLLFGNSILGCCLHNTRPCAHNIKDWKLCEVHVFVESTWHQALRENYRKLLWYRKIGVFLHLPPFLLISEVFRDLIAFCMWTHHTITCARTYWFTARHFLSNWFMLTDCDFCNIGFTL